MAVKEKLEEINEEVKAIIDSSFKTVVYTTKTVPWIDDQNITFEDFVNKSKKAKSISTCALFIDIRRSTELSVSKKSQTLTRLYSAFVRSMLKAGEYHNGKIRSIIGDRVLILFDEKDCFTNSINTAIMLNTVSEYIINKHFKTGMIECGIGIHYGVILAVKTGITKQGKDNPEYKSLVWLGNTVNLASKLTDIANKTVPSDNYQIKYEMQTVHPPFPDIVSLSQKDTAQNSPRAKIITIEQEDILSSEEFLKEVKWINSANATYKDKKVVGIKKINKNVRLPNVLMSKAVFDGYKA